MLDVETQYLLWWKILWTMRSSRHIYSQYKISLDPNEFKLCYIYFPYAFEHRNMLFILFTLVLGSSARNIATLVLVFSASLLHLFSGYISCLTAWPKVETLKANVLHKKFCMFNTENLLQKFHLHKILERIWLSLNVASTASFILLQGIFWR